MCEIISMQKWKRARRLSEGGPTTFGVDRRARPRSPERTTGGLVRIGDISAEIVRRLKE